MAEPLKTRGLSELRSLLDRVRRQRALGRIDREDFESLEGLCAQIEARIVRMREYDKDGKEIEV